MRKRKSLQAVAASAACITAFSVGGLSAFAQTYLPPGVHLDPYIQPIASENASYQGQTDAVLQVAESKIGTPYIWGHNENSGQYGFDCSNFVEYVYSSRARLQVHNVVASPVPRRWLARPYSDLKPGDLLCFEDGKHVGIYAGNGAYRVRRRTWPRRIPQQPPGSYWYKHLSAIRCTTQPSVARCAIRATAPHRANHFRPRDRACINRHQSHILQP